jgi:hypothetical protein
METIKKYYLFSFAFIPLFQVLAQIYFHKNILNLFGFFGVLVIILSKVYGKEFKYPKYLLPYILLLIYYIIWAFVNGNAGKMDMDTILYFYRNRWLYSLVVLLIIENTEFDEQFIKLIVNVFKITILVSFIVTIYQLFINPFFLMPPELKEDFFSRTQYEIRLQSIFGYIAPNEVAYSLIPIISILIGYYLMQGKSLNPVWILMAGIVFFGTKTRFIYLNFFIILLQYPLVNGLNIKKIIKVSLIGVISIVVLVFVLNSSGFNVGEFVQDRLLSESASTRLLAVDMFKVFFPKNPFFGTGIHVGEDLARAIGNRSSQIHVGYLSHLYEYGIIGTFLLLYFLLSILRKFHETSSNTYYYGSLFAFATLFVTNLTTVNFSIYSYGLLFAFIFNKFINDRYIEKNIS